VIARLFTLHWSSVGPVSISDEALTNLTALTRQRQSIIQRDISERNARFFTEESDKLEGWADDLKLGLEREIKDLDRQIRDARRSATTALTLEDKFGGAEAD